jgi:hypothetical protein
MDEMRKCGKCGREMQGRSDRKFCSAACRQKAHRNRDTEPRYASDVDLANDILDSTRFMGESPAILGLRPVLRKLIVDELKKTAAKLAP